MGVMSGQAGRYRARSKAVPYYQITPSLHLNIFQVLAHCQQTRNDEYARCVGSVADNLWRRFSRDCVRKCRMQNRAERILPALRHHYASTSFDAQAVPIEPRPASTSRDAAAEDASVGRDDVGLEGDEDFVMFHDASSEDVQVSLATIPVDADSTLMPDDASALVEGTYDESGSDGEDTPADVDEDDPHFRPLGEFLGTVRGNTATKERRLHFNELWRDFVIDNCIPRLAAERFMADIRREEPIFAPKDMPLSWKTLTKEVRGRMEQHVVKNVLLQPEEDDDELSSVATCEPAERLAKLMSGPPVITQYLPSANKRPLAKYVDFGLFKRIKFVLSRVLKATFPDREPPERPHLLLELWTDGIQPYQTGVENCVWPNCISILAIADGAESDEFHLVPPRARKPLTVGIFVSGRKPYHPEMLLRSIVDELILLDPHARNDRDNFVAGKLQEHFTVRLGRLLADTLARALAKYIPGHAAQNFCEVCTSSGLKLVNTGMIIFKTKESEMNLRTDENFLIYLNHALRPDPITGVTKASPLVDLKYFGLVSCVPFESMHTLFQLVCANFFKDLIHDRYLTKKIREAQTQFDGETATYASILDSRIAVCQALTPEEFQRKVSETKWLATWKASEHRQFWVYLVYPLTEDLLTAHPVAHKDGIIKMVRYLMTFIYLIGAVDPRPVPEEDLDFAQKLIERFATKLLHLRPGEKFATSFHLILHACRQCRELKCHYGFIAVWMYENETRYMKHFLNSGNCKAEQFRNRVLEADHYLFTRDAAGRIIRDAKGEPVTGWGGQTLLEEEPEVCIRSCGKYKTIVFQGFVISTKLADSFCLVRSSARFRDGRDRIFRVTDIVVNERDGRIFLVGHLFTNKDSVYKDPEDSKSHHVYEFSGEVPATTSMCIDRVLAKVYAVPRFSKLENPLRELRKIGDSEIGKNFELVKYWVGTTLRHLPVKVAGKKSETPMTSFY